MKPKLALQAALVLCTASANFTGKSLRLEYTRAVKILWSAFVSKGWQSLQEVPFGTLFDFLFFFRKQDFQQAGQ